MKGPIDSVTGLSCSESGGWIHKSMHEDHVTQVTYVERYGAVFSSSLDGTIKIQSITYERPVLGDMYGLP